MGHLPDQRETSTSSRTNPERSTRWFRSCGSASILTSLPTVYASIPSPYREARYEAPAKYAGVRIQLIGYLGNARSHLQVDIGFGDVVTPGPEEVEYPTILDFDAPRLLAYTPETTIAEKVEAMVTLGAANTRFKDLYDAWKLSTQRTFEGAILGEAIRTIFRRRGTELPRRIETLDAAFAAQPQKPAQWMGFLRKIQVDDCPRTLSELQTALAEFLGPLLERLEVHGLESDTRTVWQPGSGWSKNEASPVEGLMERADHGCSAEDSADAQLRLALCVTHSATCLRKCNEELSMRTGPSRNASYFVRHTEDIAVPRPDWQSLYDTDRIAIHFPDVGESTNSSLDPDSYQDPAARQAVEVFRVLNEAGGFVWAQFQFDSGTRVKIGRVVPGSFQSLPTTWESPDPEGKHGHCRTGDPTALKTLLLSDARPLDPHAAQNLRSARPKGTVARWECVDGALERLVNRQPAAESWKSLTTDQQETMCAEYLRSGSIPALPQLDALLARVGGSRAVIDVEGLATDGLLVHAQVTMHTVSGGAGSAKLETLRQIRCDSHRVFFASADHYELRDGVHIIPISTVEQWVRERAYFPALLRSNS